jgi:hypothetical protein
MNGARGYYGEEDRCIAGVSTDTGPEEKIQKI